MIRISDQEIYGNLALENPWWNSGEISARVRAFPKRSYLEALSRLVRQNDVRRSVILLGPRRVGKTVMILQIIGELLERKVPKTNILYVSLDRPLYNGITLEKIVQQHKALNPKPKSERYWFFFDEIQYLRNWEGELKSITDLYDDCMFVASGSAAAALKAKSQESGAGRFTTFLLPPLTFDEFIGFQTEKSQQHENLTRFADDGFRHDGQLTKLDIQYANILFENYCSFGGYPEAVFSKAVQGNMDRFIREDIVDKVLLRDLPSLYGISDTRELNSLFTTLALNTALEVSLDGLSQTSSVAKNTLKRYTDYLEAAFLIKRVRRIDQNARHFQRETTFKIYLTNPSLRAALFRPLSQDDDHFGHLAETAVFSQWFHDPLSEPLHYARWPDGEIDMVNLQGPQQTPDWFVEVKWSDRHLTQRESWQAIGKFISAHGRSLESGIVTSRSAFDSRNVGGLTVEVVPTAIYAWRVGRSLVEAMADQVAADLQDDEPQLF